MSRHRAEIGCEYCPTPRQMEVIRLLICGLSNKEISTNLGITPRTVRNHMSMIFERSGAVDRGHLVAIALVRGWVPMEDARKLVTSFYYYVEWEDRAVRV